MDTLSKQELEFPVEWDIKIARMKYNIFNII